MAIETDTFNQFSKLYEFLLNFKDIYFNLQSNNKEGKERLNKNMNSCIYFRKNLYCDANFAAENFVLGDETCIHIGMNYENANIRKHSLRIF
jgi:hypothetical protein